MKLSRKERIKRAEAAKDFQQGLKKWERAYQSESKLSGRDEKSFTSIPVDQSKLFTLPLIWGILIISVILGFLVNILLLAVFTPRCTGEGSGQCGSFLVLARLRILIGAINTFSHRGKQGLVWPFTCQLSWVLILIILWLKERSANVG